MAVNENNRESSQMLHSLLVDQSLSISKEHPYETDNQGTQFQIMEQQIHNERSSDLSELRWQTEVPVTVSSTSDCNSQVDVYSVNGALVWQGNSAQNYTAPGVSLLETVEKNYNKEVPKKAPVAENRRKLSGKVKTNQNNTTSSVKGAKKTAVRGKYSKSSSSGSNVLHPQMKHNQQGNSSATQNKSKNNIDILNPTMLENDALQVLERFQLGCECQEANCFNGLNPDTVFKHRLNIAELTKEEHDMYLMGLTMACLSDWGQTNRKKERQRLRANYVHQGRAVCLQAFLYLENCTLYQVKRIRKHVMTHGVVPRIHGNHGKRPHNTFSLDIYCHATEFLKMFIRESNSKDSSNKNGPILLNPDVTRKSVHQAYVEFCKEKAPGVKMLSYSTFRHFMKEQFPHIRFRHTDGLALSKEANRQNDHHRSMHLEQHANECGELQIPSLHAHQQNQVHQPPGIASPSSSAPNEMEVITFTQVLMSDPDCSDNGSTGAVKSESKIPGNDSIVVIDALPVMQSSFIATSTSRSNFSSVANNAKLLTLNSSSVRLVSGVSSSTLVPMNSLTVLSPSVIPFSVEEREIRELQTHQTDQQDITSFTDTPSTVALPPFSFAPVR